MDREKRVLVGELVLRMVTVIGVVMLVGVECWQENKRRKQTVVVTRGSEVEHYVITGDGGCCS